MIQQYSTASSCLPEIDIKNRQECSKALLLMHCIVDIYNAIVKRLLKFFDFTAVAKLFILQHESYIYIHIQT